MARPRATSDADEFGSDFARNIRAERFAGVLIGRSGIAEVPTRCARSSFGEAPTVSRAATRALQHFATEIFTNRDELHFGRDDAFARVPQLRHRSAGLRPQRSARGEL